MGRCDRVSRIAMLEGMVFTAILSMVFVVFREPLFSLFTTDPEVVDYAMRKMFFVAAFEFLTATYEVSSGALRGLGKALLPSVLTILGTVVFRMVWFYTVFAHIHTYESLMLVYTVSWIFTGIATIIARTIVARKIKKKFAQGISPEMGR